MDAAQIYREEIRDAYASAALEACMTEGALIEYQDTALAHRIMLWCAPGDEKRKLVKSGPIQEEQTTREFCIPRQCQHMDDDDPDWVEPDLRKHHFPPSTRPATNAIIHFDGYAWAAEEWMADTVEAAWTCKATRHHPRRLDENE